MMLHPYERFLGVSSDADPYAMLGLDPDRVDSLTVDDALRRRLGDIFRHPDGRSVEAEDVRAALRGAAEQIKQELRHGSAPIDNGPALPRTTAAMVGQMPAWMAGAVRSRNRPRRPGPVAFNLTAFDRLVLAALVGCGGWNARSRAQLVALAQNYGISVQGLLRVINGLSDYARAGGPRLGLSEIADKSGPPLLQPMSAAAPPAVGPGLILDRLADRFGHELRHGGPVTTIKLAIIFGVATLAIAIVVLRMMFHNDGRIIQAPQQQPVGEAAAPTTRGANRTLPRPRDGAGVNSVGVLIARFPKPPTFLGNGLPPEAVNAVDHCPALPAQIDELSRKITVADGNPSEAVYHQWEASIGTIAIAWPIGDASTRNAIDKSVIAALRSAADTPTVSDRLLKALTPPVSIAKPLDLWRGTWMAGTLGRLISTADLPPVVVDRARSELEIALSQNIHGVMPFESAGDQWLAQRIPQLVQMLPYDESAYDAWELWLAADRALGAGERHDAAVMNALRAVLESDYDLGLPGPAVNVAARLATIAAQSGSAISRQRMLELFDNEKVASRDLWVVTSLLTTSDAARWFPDRLVVPDDADMSLRWRIRDDLAKMWPAPSLAASQPDAGLGRPKIDAAEGEHWAGLAQGVLARSVGSDQTALVQETIDVSRMIEAATALAAQTPEEARRVMKEVEDGWLATPRKGAAAKGGGAAPAGSGGGGAGAPPKPRTGQPIGPDGAWATAYGQLGKGTDARTESLRSLRNTAGTDLGPIDAGLIVREAYRGSPTEVRSEAQAIIGQQFANGPNVAMQLLDQFPDAPAVESTSEMIQTITTRLLPGVRTSAWAAEARLALVQHVLDLRDAAGAPVDALIDPLIASYMNRLMLVKNDSSVTTTPSSPQEAASLLLRGLLSRAEFAAPPEPAPADLPNIQRRHNTRLSLADGPIQNFIACQLTILDVTVYAAVAEQPVVRARALEIMRQHAAVRSRLGTALEQSLDIERAILEIWRLRLGADPEQPGREGEKKEGGT